MLLIFLKMVVVHLLCDYPLQGDFLANAKNHRKPIPTVPWQVALVSHAMIQAGGVWLITNRLDLAAYEFAAHTLIDYGKNEGWYGFLTDQLLHIGCKFIWLMLL